ncbi:U1 small nuclear ribonucleoprotein 70 kDa isoform X2 [Lingula anatina]|uniref:U1 small nuclear ribonucleoprotein 70 kDa n=1 Tax=Lingula anatina TaxID=7574 RepID=A0A2R2MNZ4_LINAN|nr:U1 small nuclear ribonucleoprotein 70 kDa isoform X2 [Lingula anatina]|eukprot:XP_023931923.1 U1 small nuclear ribonucleoprotein 70 kDa isoform X2 [Lingula anatina]
MTQFLPPNLLALFAPRDPIPYLPPVTKLPHEKKRVPYFGVANNLNEFEDPKDTPPPTRAETKEERKERKRKERAEQVAYKLEQDLALWDPTNTPSGTEDPFKTLFVARINYDTSESKLRREFEVYGPVKKISVAKDRNTGKPRGYAFIEYEHERDMHSAYKHADGKKIDGRRVLVDVERARTVKGWRPRRLGGGLGGTRKGGPEVNTKFSGRDDNEGRRRSASREAERSRSRERIRSKKRSRSRERKRSRSKERRRRSRSRDRRRSRDRGDRDRGDRDRDRDRDRDKDRDMERGERDKERDMDGDAMPEDQIEGEEEGGSSRDRSHKRSRRSRSRDRKRSRSRDRKRSRRSRSRDRKRDRDRGDRDRAGERGDEASGDQEAMKAEQYEDKGEYGNGENGGENGYGEYDQSSRSMEEMQQSYDDSNEYGSVGEYGSEPMPLKAEPAALDYTEYGGAGDVSEEN